LERAESTFTKATQRLLESWRDGHAVACQLEGFWRSMRDQLLCLAITLLRSWISVIISVLTCSFHTWLTS
jgi:tRNA uridine 5-carbamoylmethylation protein Kti12